MGGKCGMGSMYRLLLISTHLAPYLIEWLMWNPVSGCTAVLLLVPLTLSALTQATCASSFPRNSMRILLT